MNDESVNDAQEKAQEAVTTEMPPEDNGVEAPTRPASAEELVKEIANEDTARIVAELLRGQQIASVYIDARSGGVFLAARRTSQAMS